MAPADSPQIVKLREWLGARSINLFGTPFSGKDTQCHRLSNIFHGPVLGGGDILRGNNMPEQVRHMMKTGELIPTKDYLKIVLPYLSRTTYTNKPLILSSVGRWHGEEPGVLEATDASGHPVVAVIYLKVDETSIFKRWEASKDRQDRSHRADDDAETLQIRLKEFKTKTEPVIQFYRKLGLLIEVDGNKKPDKVTSTILGELTKFAQIN